MLEHLHTTKMSANKKTLQNRFTKIRRKSGRISKITAAVMSCAVAVTMLGVTIVMAAVGSDGLEHWDKKRDLLYGWNAIYNQCSKQVCSRLAKKQHCSRRWQY